MVMPTYIAMSIKISPNPLPMDHLLRLSRLIGRPRPAGEASRLAGRRRKTGRDSEPPRSFLRVPVPMGRRTRVAGRVAFVDLRKGALEYARRVEARTWLRVSADP